jgi:aliphatic sulfonates family ABC transporter substrate-binding protein
MKKNTFVFVLAILVFLGSCSKPSDTSSQAAGVEEPVVIRFAIQPGDVHPVVAEKLGYYADEGLTVEHSVFSYGPPIIEAFTSKSVDLGLVGDLPAFSGIVNGIDIVIVGIASSSDTQNGIIVRDAANIKRLEDLKGKKVSVPFGSNSQPLLYLYLERAGLKDTDAEIINLPITDAVTSIVAGQIDAAVVWEPNLSAATKAGSGISILALAQGYKLFANPIIARGEFVTKYPQQTAKLLKVLHKAGVWAKANQDEAAQIVSDASGINVDAVKINISKRDYTLPLNKERTDALLLSAEQSYRYGLIAEKIDLASHIDTSYLEAAGVQ